MKTVGQKITDFNVVGVKPGFNQHEENGVSAFEPIAEQLLICAAPGAMPADTAELPWTRLRPGIRTRPNGPVFAPPNKSRLTG